MIVGPGWSPPTALATARPGPRRPDPASLCEVEKALDAEAQAPDEGERILRRLVIAIFFFAIAGPGVLGLLAWAGIELPPLLALALIGAIAVGAILTALNEPKDAVREARRARVREADAGGRALGCCSGPRPMRCFRPDR